MRIAGMSKAMEESILGEDLADVQRNVTATALRSVEDHINKLNASAEQRVFVDTLRQVIFAEVEEKVEQMTSNLWAKGRRAMQQTQLKQRETLKELEDEVTKCKEKQQLLEAENANLKRIIHGLATRFAVLGQAFAAMEAPAGPFLVNGNGLSNTMGSNSTTVPETPTLSEPGLGFRQDSASSDVFSPVISPPGSINTQSSPHGGNQSSSSHKFPEVPAFPFPSAPLPAPLSLAEALGASSQPATAQPKTPLSLAESLSASLPEPIAPGTAVGAPPGLASFSFALRKADGTELGLLFEKESCDLVVEKVLPGGAVEAWNRQCAGSCSVERAVSPGDKISAVNGITNDRDRMLQECSIKQLLKLTVVRDGQQVAKSALRADASEFVPGSSTEGCSRGLDGIDGEDDR
mmetsp:Transcript_41619/g.75490  ORF Transcript_41619/g.75490 Transcript_41619/m.75490 type:complete len:406 (+) Transcript_41619:29-1246(+)